MSCPSIQASSLLSIVSCQTPLLSSLRAHVLQNRHLPFLWACPCTMMDMPLDLHTWRHYILQVRMGKRVASISPGRPPADPATARLPQRCSRVHSLTPVLLQVEADRRMIASFPSRPYLVTCPNVGGMPGGETFGHQTISRW